VSEPPRRLWQYILQLCFFDRFTSRCHLFLSNYAEVKTLQRPTMLNGREGDAPLSRSQPFKSQASAIRTLQLIPDFGIPAKTLATGL